jgi:hypothetical protein
LLFLLGSLICLPWAARNQILYHDPLGWGAFVHYFKDVKHSPTPATMTPPGMAYSPVRYWGETVLQWGYQDSLGMWLFARPGHPLPMKVSFKSTLPFAYPLWGILWVGALIGVGRFWMREGRKQTPEWKRMAFVLGLALLLLFVAYLRLNAVFFWAHSRYVFPAVGTLALTWAVGLSRLVPERYRPALLWGVSGVLFFFSLFASYSLLGGFFESLAAS